MAEISLEYVKEMMAKGNVEEAMKSLASMLQSNNKDIVAWLFLAELMDDPVKKRVLPAGLEVVTIQRRCFEGMEKLDSSNVRRRGTDNVNGLSTSSDRKVASESRQTRRDNSHSQKKRRQSKGYFFMWTSVLSAICIFSFIFLFIGRLNITNIRMKNIYWHTNYDSRNVDINISFSLKEYPSDLTTIYAENIIFTFKDGWTPHKQYLNSAFDIQTGDPKRFAFHLDRGSNTGNLGIFSPPTLLYYYKDDALLNVDEWIKRDSCPFKKIQLQGLSANTKFELPDTLDIPFPCDLEYVKVCLEHDTVYNACMKWASKE